MAPAVLGRQLADRMNESSRRVQRPAAGVTQADICNANRHVRFSPESGYVQCDVKCPLWANSGHRYFTRPRLNFRKLTRDTLRLCRVR
jgi:hypothetical protein